MKQIPLVGGRFAVVDDWNYDRLVAMGPWYCKDNGTTIYARRLIGSRYIAMHNCIKDAPKGTTWDHINRNGLDNREENLRPATGTQQKANTKLRIDNSSGCRGVWQPKGQRNWRARITVGGKAVDLGRFDTMAEAVRARNDAARYYFKEFAQLDIVDDVTLGETGESPSPERGSLHNDSATHEGSIPSDVSCVEELDKEVSPAPSEDSLTS